jgi:hypothetical protein
MKFEVSGGIFDTGFLGETLHPLGWLFEFEHVFGGSECQFGLGARRHFRSDGMLELGIEALLRIQFRNMANGMAAPSRNGIDVPRWK